MNSLKKHGWTIVHELCWQLSKIVPKNKTWVFGAWAGLQYSDNAKYMYTYIIENHKEINAVWITKDKLLAMEMRKKGLNSYYYHEIKGILASLRASVVFTTSGYGDIAEWAHPKTLHVSLWHGTPLKKIGYDNNVWTDALTSKKEQSKQKIKNVFLPYVTRDDKCTIYVVSSEEVRKTYLSCFRAKVNQIVVAGQPRNDVFVKPLSNAYFENLKMEKRGTRIVCYMPTHRNFGKTKNSPFNEKVLKETDAILREKNIILIFKPHFHEMKNFVHMQNSFTNIILGLDKNIFSDAYAFLPYCDALISDYSSIIVDFMCSGKPIIFYPYDLQEYLNSDAGLYYKYEDFAVGPLCYTWNDVLSILDTVFWDEQYTDKYISVASKFNYFNDGNNCMRTYNAVITALEKKKKDGVYFEC